MRVVAIVRVVALAAVVRAVAVVAVVSAVSCLMRRNSTRVSKFVRDIYLTDSRILFVR